MIGLRRVVSFGYLINVKTILHLHVRGRFVLIGYDWTVFLCQLGIQHWNRSVGGKLVTGIVGSIMRQSTESEREFIQISGFIDQGKHKITAPHIMRQITKKLIGERVVTEILDYGPAVSIGVSSCQFVGSREGKSAQECRLNGVLPSSIDNRLVRQDRIAVRNRYTGNSQEKP